MPAPPLRLPPPGAVDWRRCRLRPHVKVAQTRSESGIDAASRQLLRELEITTTALVAHDYGVSVARDPERVTRMVWCNGGLYPDLHRPTTIQKALHGPIGGMLSRLTLESSFRSAINHVTGRPLPSELLHDLWLAVRSNNGRQAQHSLLGYIDERLQHGERWVDALEAYAGATLLSGVPPTPSAAPTCSPSSGSGLLALASWCLTRHRRPGTGRSLKPPRRWPKRSLGFLAPAQARLLGA